MNTIELVSLLTNLGLSLKEIARLRPDDVRDGVANTTGARSRALLGHQAARVLSASDNSNNIRHRCMVRLGLYVGARQCEIARLTSRDVERTGSGVYVTLIGKCSKRRRVWVPDDLGIMLTMISASRIGRLFPWSPRYIRSLLTSFMRTAGLRGGPHRLRHTAATWMLNSGSTLEEAMEVLGHSDVTSHEVYAIASDGWLMKQWAKFHPLSGGIMPEAHIVVRGEQLRRHMARGVERTVPLPAGCVDEVRSSLPTEQYRNITRAFYRKSSTSPSEMRESLSVTLAERGMHPFAISLILGVTPSHVVDSRWDRRGVEADRGRREAIERAVANVKVAV